MYTKIIGEKTIENINKRLLQVKWIYQYVRKYWGVMSFYTLMGLLGTGMGLSMSLVSKELIDIITGHDSGTLIKTFLVMIGLNLGNSIVGQISGYVSNYISMKVDAEIKADVFSKIMITDWEVLANYHTGDLLTRWGSDVSNISIGVLNFIPNTIICIFRFVSALVIVVYYDWTFAVLALLGMPISFLMSKTLLRRMVTNNQRSAAMNAKISGFNQEAFSNIQTIKAFDLARRYVQRLREIQKEYITMRLDFQKMSMFTSFLMTIVGMVVTYSSYGWGIYRVWSGGITYGTMTMFLTLSGTLTSEFHSMTSLLPTAISLTTSAGRLMDIVEMPREDYSNDDLVKYFYENNKEHGISLKMSDVNYSYKNGTEVFASASIEVKPHEIIALVGPSGEGKTTMLRLILSIMRTQSGTAYLTGEGGADKQSDSGKSLFMPETKGLTDEEILNQFNAVPLTPSTRKLFSYVPQGNTMFSGTIAENMRNVKPEATDEEIIEVLKKACAWEFVEKLPAGIDSEIKERGGGFSEGQAQRLSIARALLRDAPILLLDEATSALDVSTERRVLRNIMLDVKPRTCIVTTHRPSVLSACTRVYGIRDKKCVVLNEEEIEELVRGF